MAAADYAERKPDATPPPELSDWLRSKQFDTLPRAGGWKDQPYRYVNQGLIYYNVFRDVREYRAALKDGKTFKRWIKENPEVMETIRKIEDMRRGIDS